MEQSSFLIQDFGLAQCSVAGSCVFIFRRFSDWGFGTEQGLRHCGGELERAVAYPLVVRLTWSFCIGEQGKTFL